MKYFKHNLLPIQRPSRHSTKPPSHSLPGPSNSRPRDAAPKVIGKIAAYHAQAPKGEGGGAPPEVPPAFLAVPHTIEQKIFPTICGLCATETKNVVLSDEPKAGRKKAAKRCLLNSNVFLSQARDPLPFPPQRYNSMSEAYYVRTNRPNGFAIFPFLTLTLLFVIFPIWLHFLFISYAVPCGSKPDRNELNHRPKGPIFCWCLFSVWAPSLPSSRS